MSQLLQKSNDSLVACQVLIEKPHELYTASVHHAYYSSLQRSIYVLHAHFPANAADLTDDGNSHVRTIKVLEQKLVDNGYRFEAFDYEQDMGKLKRNRVQADYRLLRFSESQSKVCLQLAQKVNNLLDKAYTNFAEKSSN